MVRVLEDLAWMVSVIYEGEESLIFDESFARFIREENGRYGNYFKLIKDKIGSQKKFGIDDYYFEIPNLILNGIIVSYNPGINYEKKVALNGNPQIFDPLILGTKTFYLLKLKGEFEVVEGNNVVAATYSKDDMYKVYKFDVPYIIVIEGDHLFYVDFISKTSRYLKQMPGFSPGDYLLLHEEGGFDKWKNLN